MGRGQVADPAVAGEAEGGGPSSGIAAGDGPDRPAANPVARVVVVLLALAVIVLAGTGAVKATVSGIQDTDSSRTADGRLYATQLGTVRGELLAQVPAGSTVFLALKSSNAWYQRIIEFATMGSIVVVPDAARADFTVSLVTGLSTPIGLRLLAQRTG